MYYIAPCLVLVEQLERAVPMDTSVTIMNMSDCHSIVLGSSSQTNTYIQCSIQMHLLEGNFFLSILFSLKCSEPTYQAVF